MITTISIVLIIVNFPFVRRVENIAQRTLFSSGAATLSSGIYLGLFFSLFFDPVTALIFGVVLGAALWIVLGGVQLFRMVQTSPTPLTAA